MIDFFSRLRRSCLNSPQPSSTNSGLKYSFSLWLDLRSFFNVSQADLISVIKKEETSVIYYKNLPNFFNRLIFVYRIVLKCWFKNKYSSSKNSRQKRNIWKKNNQMTRTILLIRFRLKKDNFHKRRRGKERNRLKKCFCEVTFDFCEKNIQNRNNDKPFYTNVLWPFSGGIQSLFFRYKSGDYSVSDFFTACVCEKYDLSVSRGQFRKSFSTAALPKKLES